MKQEKKKERTVVYFDGVCNLCNRFVDFLIRRDRNRRLRYASLQSAKGQAVMATRRYWGKSDESVLFVDDGEIYDASSAALRILMTLGGVYRLAGALRILPTEFRDFLYEIVADRRYRWFGKRDTCRVPTPEEADLFLEE